MTRDSDGPNLEAGEDDRNDQAPEQILETPSEQSFRAGLLRAARQLDVPRPSLQAQISEALRDQPPARSQRRPLMGRGVIAAGLSLAAAVALFFLWTLVARTLDDRDPQRAARIGPEPSADSSSVAASAAAPLPAPLPAPREPLILPACEQRYRASREHPLIDDFEDGNGMVMEVDGRSRPWLMHFDFDEEGEALRVLTPEPRDQHNRFALHLKGPALSDWGAVADLSFEPHRCYDATTYAGLEFWAKGPGRVRVGVRELRVIPTRWGGGCVQTHTPGSKPIKDECYNAHASTIDLTPEWSRYTVPWDRMKQRGDDMPAVDPSSLHSIQFEIEAENTPFEIWIDDIAFMTNQPHR